MHPPARGSRGGGSVSRTARAAFPALPDRVAPSGWAKRRGSGGGTPVSLPLEISFCFPRRQTHPLPFLRKGDLFSGTGKKNFFFEDGGGWQRQGLLLLFFQLPLLPLQDRKANPTTAPASSFPSSTSLSPPLPVSLSPLLIISLLCFPLWGVSSLSDRREALASPGCIS